MKKHYYLFTDEIGNRWRVPLSVIASSYFQYFGGREDGPKTLDEAYEMMVREPDEAEDWARNNMDWPEVSAHAEKIENVQPDPRDAWINPDYVEIKEMEA